MAYMSRGDRYENLSAEEYLKMIRPYLKKLINDHKPTTKLNDKAKDVDTERGEWKIRLLKQNKCIYTKDFKETQTIYSASKIFMGTDTDDAIDNLFDTLLQRFQEAVITSHRNESGFTHESVALLYYYFQKTDIRRAESYTESPDWIRNKSAKINPKNEKDNKLLSVVNNFSIKLYNFKKIFEKIEKFKRVDTDFSSYQRDCEEFEQNNTLITHNVLFISCNSEEIKPAYKSRYNYKRKNM